MTIAERVERPLDASAAIHLARSRNSSDDRLLVERRASMRSAIPA
jgi:hypothetical protein